MEEQREFERLDLELPARVGVEATGKKNVFAQPLSHQGTKE